MNDIYRIYILDGLAGGPDRELVSPMQSRTDTQASAVVSIAGRYPGAEPDSGIAGFWQVVESQVDLPSTVPLQRWDIEEYYGPESKGQQLSMYVRMASFVDQLDCFDHNLFRCYVLHSILLKFPFILSQQQAQKTLLVFKMSGSTG